ncbi:Hypothetical predicted protein [Mytilus galloprovincialis]|uniref:Uncharacterized protein n=1 Tax=Mytilus galloprovincialis TaxID=29158 RepID=A0A8B6G8J5_MYTGA|nr:Hypothetical predicted protein [Mytilus galloprovincialis]
MVRKGKETYIGIAYYPSDISQTLNQQYRGKTHGSSDEEPLELVIVEHDASSGTTISEEHYDDSTVTDITEDSDSDGDAHSQEATDMEADGTETESVIRSASTVSREDSQ